jgi:hypothetical protein
MKKTVVLLLAVLMIVGLCVSCEDPKKPEATEDTLRYVVDRTRFCFVLLQPSIEELATGSNPEKLEEEIYDVFAFLFDEHDDLDVEATDDPEKALSVNVTEGEERFFARFSEITLSSDGETVSGKIEFSTTWIRKGEPLSMDIKGSFSFDDDNLSVTYSDVTFNSVAYKVEEFNTYFTEWDPPIT